MERAKPTSSAGQNSANTNPSDHLDATSATTSANSEGAEGTLVAGRARSFGYARVSTDDGRQDTSRQVSELNHCDRVFTDEISGGTRTADRPGFALMLSHLREGDRVEVVSLDRLSRSLEDLMHTLDDLTNRNITVVVHGLGTFDPGSPMTRLLWQVLGAVGEMQRALIRQATISGLQEAKRRGVKIGRPAALSPEQVRGVRAMRDAGSSAAATAAAFGVSERTVRRYS
jgi:DNA invertase Pin-like site-specific DNA recombinase